MKQCPYLLTREEKNYFLTWEEKLNIFVSSPCFPVVKFIRYRKYIIGPLACALDRGGIDISRTLSSPRDLECGSSRTHVNN